MVDGFGPDISFAIIDNAGVNNEIANFGAVRDGADNSGALVFSTVENGVLVTIKAILKANGNFGIGTTTPASKLAVNGSITESTDGVNYYNVVTQQDIGTEPNEIPLNQYLGSMAYQNADSIRVTDLTVDGNLTVVGAQTLAGNITLGDASGDTVTINAGTTTLTQGTANGVLYLNGSKAITSGSALTFDQFGQFCVGGAANSAKFSVTDGSTARINIAPASTYVTISARNVSVTSYVPLVTDSSEFQFNLGGTEKMRLTSTGLGIGTTAPVTTFHTAVYGGISATIDRVGDFGPSLQFIRNGVAGSAALGLALDSALGLYTNNAERMRITSAGNVGIGTSAPTNKLRVSSSDSSSNVLFNDATKGIRFGNGASGSAIEGVDSTGVGTFQPLTVGGSTLNFSISGVTKATIDSAGNLGLGVTPSAWFSSGIFQGNSFSISSIAGIDQTAWVTGAYQSTYTGSWLSRGAYNATMYQHLTGGHAWLTNDSTPSAAGQVVSFAQAMTLSASGNLGIGTTSPSSRLNIAGGALPTSGLGLSINGGLSLGRLTSTGGGLHIEALSTFYDDKAVEISAGSSSGYVSGIVVGARDYLGGGGDAVSFYTRSTERMRIDSAGNVGIGTSAPDGSFKLTVTGNSAGVGPGVLFTDTAASPTNYAVYINGNKNFVIRDQTASVNRITVQATTGNVGIGNTTPAAKLQVDQVGIETTTTVITTTAETIVYSYPAATFRTAELMCQIVDSTNSQYHSTKFMVIHNSTDVWFNQTSVIHSHDELGTFTVNISGGNVRLLFTPVAATTKSVKVAATMLTS